MVEEVKSDKRTTQEIITAYLADPQKNAEAVRQRVVRLGMDMEGEGFLNTDWHGEAKPEDYVKGLTDQKAWSLLFDLNATSENIARRIANMEYL